MNKKRKNIMIAMLMVFTLFVSGIACTTKASAASITKGFTTSPVSPYVYYFAGYDDKTVTATFTAAPNSASYVVKATVSTNSGTVFSSTFNSAQPHTVSFKLVKDTPHKLVIIPVGYNGTVSGTFTIKYSR